MNKSLIWLERERILSRALLLLTSIVFAAAKIITPWNMFDLAAILVFVALVFAAVKAHRRVEEGHRSGHGTAPKSILVATELDLIAVVVIGAFIIRANAGFSGLLHGVAMSLGAVAVALASFRGYFAYFKVWKGVRDHLPAVLEYSWGDLLDEDGPFGSRAPREPASPVSQTGVRDDVFRKVRKRRKVRR